MENSVASREIEHQITLGNKQTLATKAHKRAWICIHCPFIYRRNIKANVIKDLDPFHLVTYMHVLIEEIDKSR